MKVHIEREYRILLHDEVELPDGKTMDDIDHYWISNEILYCQFKGDKGTVWTYRLRSSIADLDFSEPADFNMETAK